MVLSRRSFLRNGAIAASALSSIIGEACAETRALMSGLSESSWADIRGLFDLDASLVNMAGLLLASHPRPVNDAIAAYRRVLDRNPALVLEWELKAEDAVRAAAARYLDANVDEIALTDSTTMGLGLLFGGIKIRKDQEILFSMHDHMSTGASIVYKCQAVGCSYRRVALFDKSAEADAQEIVERLRGAIRDHTRVVAMTFVHSSTGLKLPLADIGRMIGEVNDGRTPGNRVLFCVDGVHGLGVENFRVRDLGCDFYVAGCHKWLFGPRGTGLVWGRQESWEHVAPIIPTFSGRNKPGKLMTPGGFHSFEHRWALDKAFEFHLSIGKQRIQERIHFLNSSLKRQLAGIKGLILHTPRSDALSAGIICFELPGKPPRGIVEYLASNGIVASTTPYAVSYARLAPGLLNDESELERTVQVLANS